MDRYHLVVDGRPVTVVEVARSFAERSRGLLGRTGLDGALLLQPCSSVHTARMQFALDVAFLDADLRVRSVRSLEPWRLSRPRRHIKAVLEAEAGTFGVWGLQPGVLLELGDRVHEA
jgi:uncharacterized membrane protein (UPF0127 family)